MASSAAEVSPSAPGKPISSMATSGRVFQRGGHDQVTGCHRDGHLDVRLQAQQRNQRVPHHADVLGDQDADHRALRTARASSRARRAGDAGICMPPISASLGHRPAVA
jgi:hypothetical protein